MAAAVRADLPLDCRTRSPRREHGRSPAWSASRLPVSRPIAGQGRSHAHRRRSGPALDPPEIPAVSRSPCRRGADRPIGRRTGPVNDLRRHFPSPAEVDGSEAIPPGRPGYRQRLTSSARLAPGIVSNCVSARHRANLLLHHVIASSQGDGLAGRECPQFPFSPAPFRETGPQSDQSCIRPRRFRFGSGPRTDYAAGRMLGSDVTLRLGVPVHA